ncbi:MAG: hypothetical protein AAFY70_16970, partial [Bacteroidota bacterium]
PRLHPTSVHTITNREKMIFRIILDLTFQNVERQFELGASNSVDFLVAKNNLNRAKFDRVRSKFDYIFRVKILDFYQGKPIDF